MKREWSGCKRRRRTPAAIAFPTARRCVPRRRVVLLRRAFQHPARPRPSRADALPAQVLRQADRSRGRVGQAPFKPRHRQATHCSGEVPQCALQVRNRPAAGATRGKTSLGNIREMPQRACSARACHRWLEMTGARGSGSGLNRASGLRRPVRGDCRVQAGSASRSSGVMRASTALRTSGPALCSMALQSAALWMVATVRRGIS